MQEAEAAKGVAVAAGRATGARITFALTIPRQHGAWSVLILGLALGVAVAGTVRWETGLLLVSALSALPARHVLSWWWRLAPGDARRPQLARWVAGYGLACALSAGALLLGGDRWLLVPLGALAGVAGLLLTALERRGTDRGLGGELLGMAGLSLAVPAAAYATTGVFTPALMALWALACLVFTGSVFHVRFLTRAGAGAPRGRALAGTVYVVYHLSVVGAAIAMGLTGVVPGGAYLAALPGATRAAWAVLRPRQTRVPVRRLGFEELAYGAAFAVLAALIFRGAV